MRTAEHDCFPPPFRRTLKALCLRSSPSSLGVGPTSGERRGRRSHNLLPASPDRRPERAGRQLGGQIGGVGLTGPSTQDLPYQFPGCPSSWGQTAARGGRRAPWTLGTTSRTSRTRPASRSLRLCAQQPSPAALRAPTRRRSAPGDRDQAAHRPAGASLAGEPLACPSPYLLQPGPLPPSLAFDAPALQGSGSPQTRPRPAPARPRAVSSPQVRPQTPSKHAPLTPPQAVCSSGGALLGSKGNSKESKLWVLPG